MSDASNAKPESLPVSSDDGMPTSMPNPISSLPPATLPTGTPVDQEAEPAETREEQILKYVGDPEGKYVTFANQRFELVGVEFRSLMSYALEDKNYQEGIENARRQVQEHLEAGNLQSAELHNLRLIDLHIRRALLDIFGPDIVNGYFVGTDRINSEAMDKSPANEIVHRAVMARQALLSRAYDVRTDPSRYDYGRDEGIPAGVIENPAPSDIEIRKILPAWNNDQVTMQGLFEAGREIAQLINEHLVTYRMHGEKIEPNFAGKNVIFINVEKPNGEVELRSVQASVEPGDVAIELARYEQRLYSTIKDAVSEKKQQAMISGLLEKPTKLADSAVGGIRNGVEWFKRSRGTNR